MKKYLLNQKQIIVPVIVISILIVAILTICNYSNVKNVLVSGIMPKSNASVIGNGGTSNSGDTNNSKATNVNELKAGDYVAYTDKNGNQVPCVVLYDTDYNTTNGTDYGVQIITRNPVTTVELGNGTGYYQEDVANFNKAKNVYNNAISTLNTAATTYVNANTNLVAIAKSSRCVGSVPNNPSAQNTAWYAQSHSWFTTNYTKQFNAPESDSAYTASNAENYSVDKAQLDSLGIAAITDTTNYTYYWLASRIVYPGSESTAFAIRTFYASYRFEWGRIVSSVF